MPQSKKLSKSENLPKFDVKEVGPNFLTPFIFPPITLALSFDLCDLRPTLAPKIFKWPTGKASLERSLYCWQHKPDVVGAARQKHTYLQA